MDKKEQTIFRSMPRRLKNIVTSHMMYYEGVEDQTMQDYCKAPISYILNFMLEVDNIRKFCPKSYSNKKINETHKELIELCLIDNGDEDN